MKELFELSSAHEQVCFIEAFLPWALEKLQSVQISFNAYSAEHNTRAGLLGILRIVPAYPDTARPHVEALTAAMFQVLQQDADDNAAEAMQIFMDLNKAFRAILEHHVAPFLDFILDLANSFEEITRERLADSSQTSVLPLARRSFRLLHDAPVMIVLVFQLHRRFINEFIPKFVPVIIKVLQVDAERPTCQLPVIDSIEKLASQPVFTPRGPFNDYISAQIKVFWQYNFPSYGIVGAFLSRIYRPWLRSNSQRI